MCSNLTLELELKQFINLTQSFILNDGSASSLLKHKDIEFLTKDVSFQSINEKFIFGSEIIDDDYCSFKEGISKLSGKRSLIKFYSSNIFEESEFTLLMIELQLLKRLEHSNLLKILEIIQTEDLIYGVFEDFTSITLFDFVKENGTLNDKESSFIIKQILDLLNYLQEKKLYLYDITPHKIVLLPHKKNHIKLLGLGFSNSFETPKTGTLIYVPEYVSPECILKEKIDKFSNIWSVGVIAYFLLYGQNPFYCQTRIIYLFRIFNVLFRFPAEKKLLSEEAKDFIKKILVKEAEKRLSLEECLNHPWIKNTKIEEKNYNQINSMSIQKFKKYYAIYKNQTN